MIYDYFTMVRKFGVHMMNKMADNDDKGVFENRPYNKLLDLLDDEVWELRAAVVAGNLDEITQEAADVANFAMMIAYKANLKEKKDG